MVRFPSRSAFVLALALFGTRPAAAEGLPVAPPPRPAMPFDLTYLPPDCAAEGLPRLLVAVRPAAVFRHPDATKLAVKADEALGGLAREWLGAAQTAGPGVDAVESVLLTGHVTIVHNGQAEKPNSLIGNATGVVVRTREPFDWAEAVAGWYPDAKAVKHKGTPLTLIPLPPALAEFFPPTGADAMFTVYVPDDRTIVLGPEASIRKLVDRVKAGGKAPRPAGWDEVERADLAVAVEVPDKAMIDRMPPQDVAEAKVALRVAKLTHTAVVGAWARDTTTVRMAFTARNPKAARQVAKGLRELGPAIDAALREPPEDERAEHEEAFVKAARSLSETGRIELDGTVVRVRAEAPGNLLDHLVPILVELSSRSAARK